VRLSLSAISTVNASFAEDVAAYSSAGFDAVGLWEFKLPADDEANRALLRDHGLAVSNCVPSVPSLLPLRIPGMEGPSDPAERVDALSQSIRRLAAYDPESVLFLAGPLGAREPAAARALVVDGIRQVAGVARATGVRVGLEPTRPEERETTSFVTTVADAVALLDEADAAADIGLMFDSFNLAHESPEEVARLAARATGLHLADTPERLTDGRQLPARDGVSRAFVDAFRAAGWDGSLDVEIFSTPDSFWGLPVEEAARRAHAAASALLA
jgi:sugar phosphate isomerase/epimerase